MKTCPDLGFNPDDFELQLDTKTVWTESDRAVTISAMSVTLDPSPILQTGFGFWSSKVSLKRGRTGGYDLEGSEIDGGGAGARDRDASAGFIVGGNGGGNSGIMVRAIAPSLSALIPGVLPDPTLELKDANGSTLVFNDDWQQSPQASAISARGLAPSDTREAALAVSLSNGAYTAIVRGKDGATGVAVVEVYNVD